MTRKGLEHTLHDYVQLAVKDYLQQMGDQTPDNLYQLVISETETALLKTVLQYADYNQRKAAQFLGISRGTLRKKLKEYGIHSSDE